MPYKCLKKEYKKRKCALIKMLGGKCEDCGEKVRLQFHHRQSRTWVAKKVNCLTRMKLYLQEATQGIVYLLCEWCNKTEGIPD